MSAVLDDHSFGAQLRRWRGQRGLSQMALALQADVSARHLSWLETSKAEPSRAMVLRLAEQLDLPLRERNALLVAAGYAPLYRESQLDDASLGPVRGVLQRLLDAHAPAPALAVDRHWNVVAYNRVLPLLLHGLPAELVAAPVNVLKLSLHPQGLAPMIQNLGPWRAHVLARVQRQATSSGDPRLAALLTELKALPGPPYDEGDEATHDEVVVPLVLNTALGQLNFITTITVFGAPHDVTLAEIAIETLLPADRETADRLQTLLASATAA